MNVKEHEKLLRVGFYPGTFDPITFGHLDIIKRSAELFDHLIVGVAINEGKNPFLSFEERKDMIQYEVLGLSYAQHISVIGFKGLLIDAVHEHGAGTIIRGLRSAGDFDFETQLSGALRRLAPEIETVFLLASENHRTTASSVVKEIAMLGGDISAFVSENVKKTLLSKIKKNTIS